MFIPESSLTRRQWMCSTLALGAFLLPGAGANADAARRRQRARSTIFIMLEGGMSHLESWDPKPNAPKEVRGEFGTIATAVSGLRISEHLPRLAQQAHLYNLLRSVHCDARNDHSPGMHLLLTGWENTNAGVALETTNRKHPAQGCILAHERGVVSPSGAPRFVALPRARQIGGQVKYAGPSFLGSTCEAFETGDAPADASRPMQLPPSLGLARDLPLGRLNDRQALRLALGRLNVALERDPTARRIDAQYQKALQILTGQGMCEALDLQREPVSVRERYGNHRIGQSLLLARRLVERDVTYVLVDPYGNNDWDTHNENFKGHKALLPPMDQAVAALLVDLEQRGLLDEVVVVLASEMGRAPRISGHAGRDHWTYAYSVMIAGGGLTRGQVLGETTSKGEWPSRRPVTVPEIHATIYRQLGIDPNAILHDALGRPIPILPEGRPIRELIA
ncbi:MAG TPA: DUF1501 domain-containing protein [Gemmataceae bacterium]|jgi:hypothetical protein